MAYFGAMELILARDPGGGAMEVLRSIELWASITRGPGKKDFKETLGPGKVDLSALPACYYLLLLTYTYYYLILITGATSKYCYYYHQSQ